MQIFILSILSFVVFVFCPANTFGQEKSPVDVPLEVIANQVVEPMPFIESQAPESAQKQQSPLKIETPPVVVNQVIEQEETPDDRVSVESVTTPFKSSAVFADHDSFNRMKQLAGRWEGLSENIPGQAENKIVVIYEVTAGGNAILERIFPGSSQEMITMYYEEKGQLTLTHYCMIGTRSIMKLKAFVVDVEKEQKNVYEFYLAESPALDPAVDTHMHSLKITFIDENHMNQAWEMFEAGKLSGSYSFVLTRVPNNS